MRAQTAQTPTAIAMTREALPAVTDGAAVIADILNIENRLANLPTDIASYIQAVDQRLSSVEDLLSSLLSNLPAAVTITPSATDYLQIAESTAYTTAPDLTTNGAVDTSIPSITQQTPSSNGTIAPAYTNPYPTGTAPITMSSSTINYTQPTSPPAYTFNSSSTNNVAVYYGQSPATQAGGLVALCQNENVDIVILAFVYDFFTQGGYPSIDFGPACSSPNELQATRAPGLQDCSALAPDIIGCQTLGKKVLVSLGGYIANSSFTSDDQAEQFAETLWNLFGAGTGDDSALRPFGSSVIVDGFDIDNENHVTDYYITFATALRQHFASDPSKTYHLSAAPQCPMPDDSIPLGVMTQADFVWVQFYNNPSCNLDSEGFQDSFAAWSANLSASSTTPGKPRVYVGAGAFSGAGSGYVQGDGLSGPVSLGRELHTDNLGGIMLWDGSEALANVDQYGVDYLEYAKAALQG